MNDINEWVKRLEAAYPKERPSIAGELAKFLGISVPEAWKKLKEAGWESKKDAPSGGVRPVNTINLRHKTGYPSYRRAGLLLTNQFKPYEVTAEQLETFKNDPWVEIGK